MDNQKYLDEKGRLLLQIENSLKSWDKTFEHALDLLEKNEECFAKLQKIDQHIPKSQMQQQNFQLSERLQNIVRLQKEMSACVREEQLAIQERIEQVSNRQKVVSNYISLQNKSIFVEKKY